MKNKIILAGFVGTLLLATLLRLFVFDVVSISNNTLMPHFYSGDFVLISKISKADVGQWVFLKHYPQKSTFTVRKLVGNLEKNKGWMIEDPTMPHFEEGSESQVPRAFIPGNKIVGRVVMILWSFCKSEGESGAACRKENRFLTLPN